MDDNKLSAKEINAQELDEAIERLNSEISRMNERLEERSAHSAKSDLASQCLKSKIIITMVATGLLLISLAVCTYAYFVATTTSGGNIISTGYADVTLYDVTDSAYLPDPGVRDAISIFPGTVVSKTVYAKNNGAYPVYIRAKIEDTITLAAKYAEHQDEIDLSLVTYDLDLDNWTKHNGYYYYNTPIVHGESTTLLLSQVKFSEEIGNIYKDSTIVVKVTLEAVQSNNNGATVFDAVGWTSTGEGGAS